MNVRYDFEPVDVTALAGESPRQLYLITAWNETSNRPMHLLTNRVVKSSADALFVIIGYLSRWSVEETYRFYKTGQGLEASR